MSKSLHWRTFARALLVLLCLLLPQPLPAAKTPEPRLRKIGIYHKNGKLAASFTFRDAFTKEVRSKLTSGLPTRLVMQIALEKYGQAQPVDVRLHTTHIVYDLWDETFIIQMDGDDAPTPQRVRSLAEVVERSAIYKGRPMVSISGRSAGTYRLRIQIEVNPVSKETVSNIRRWLSQPRNGKDGSGQSNFFGSFVGVFVDRQIGQADKRISFVSQWFRVGEP